MIVANCQASIFASCLSGISECEAWTGLPNLQFCAQLLIAGKILGLIVNLSLEVNVISASYPQMPKSHRHDQYDNVLHDYQTDHVSGVYEVCKHAQQG
jgi:hypothetical protein